MKLPLSLELAAAILLRKKRLKDSPLFAAFIGITLSIIPLVLVIEVSDGMISGIMNRYIETFYSHIILRFYNEPDEKGMQTLQDKISDVADVRIAYKERTGAALLIAAKQRSAVQVRSLAFDSDPGFRKYLTLKSGTLDLKPGSILLASDVAFKLGLEIGQYVALLTGARFGGKLRPKLLRLEVAGIMSTGYQELDRMWAFISNKDAERFFHRTNSELLMHVKIDDAFQFNHLQKVAQEIQNQINPRVARVRTWYDQAFELQQSYKLTKSILVYIMYLILAVGTISIASSMVLLVLENSSEIAIMKTFGANKPLICRIYIWVAILISSIAIVYGISLGVLFSYFINEIIHTINWLLHAGASLGSGKSLDLLDKSYYLEQVPIRIQILPLALVAVSVIALTFLFSIFPALKAANMLPLAILRQNRN